MTRERLAEFQALLGVEDQGHAWRMWKVIERAKPLMERFERGRRRIPDAQKAKRHLAAVAGAARRLSALLAREPLNELLLNGGMFPGALSEDCQVILPTDLERRAFAAAPGEFVKRLDGVATVAQLLADDDERFRLAHVLPNADHGAVTTAALVLWPLLFSFWEEEGRTLSHTPNGPLHRFVAFVHREFGLAKPSASTLRDAIQGYHARQVDTSAEIAD